MAARPIGIIFVLLVCTGSVYAQTGSDKMQTNISLGSSFTSTSGYGSGLTNYISPVVTYRVNPRLSFRAGVTLSNTFLFDYKPWYSTESVSAYNANFSKALVFVQGSYMVTPRLRISGAAFKEFTLTDDSPDFNPYTQNNPYGFSLNADYQVSDRVHIQAGFSYIKGYTPYADFPLCEPGLLRGSFLSGPYRQGLFTDPWVDPFGASADR